MYVNVFISAKFRWNNILIKTLLWKLEFLKYLWFSTDNWNYLLYRQFVIITNAILNYRAVQTKLGRQNTLFSSQKVLMKIPALLYIERGNVEKEVGKRASIIKAAFWFDQKLFSSRHLRSRAQTIPIHARFLRSRSLSKRGTHYSRVLADVSVDR